MPSDLSTLVSQPLVAFTIELDDEYEHQTIDRTSVQHRAGASQSGAWLTSFAMYSNCLQFLGDSPISVRDLEKLARTQ
jgi:hypothetical protein